MGDSKPEAPAMDLIDDLLEPGPEEIRLPRLDADSEDVFDAPTRRISVEEAASFDPFAPDPSASDPFGAEPLVPAPRAPSTPRPSAPAAPSPPSRVPELPATVVVIDPDRQRGARSAGRLMEVGYTARVLDPTEVDAVVDPVAAAVLAVDPGSAPHAARARAWVEERLGCPVVLSGALDRLLGGPLLLEPWTAEQAVALIEPLRENARATSVEAGAALSPPSGAVEGASPPAPEPEPEADPFAPEELAAPVAKPAGLVGLPKVESSTGARAPVDPSSWERLEARVVQVRIADEVGEGYTPGRAVAASYDGHIDVDCRRSLPPGTPLMVELTLLDGRRADFEAVAVSTGGGAAFRLELEVEAADVPFYYGWVEASLDPAARDQAPVRVAATGKAPERAPSTPPGAVTLDDLEVLWAEAQTKLDDDAIQQRFIQACVRSQEMDFAVRRYRALKEARPDDERAQRYLAQVGTILGFYALDRSSAVEEGGMSNGVKLTLLAFVLAAAVLGVLAFIAR